jgi:hypothetical protein
LIFELILIFIYMLELLQIKQQLEGKSYTNANSLFELRVLLMDIASVLTRKNLSNIRQQKDVKTSALLLKAFNNIRNYFYIIETTKREHEDCFLDIQQLVITDIATLLSSSDYKIISLQNTSPVAFGIAK